MRSLNAEASVPVTAAYVGVIAPDGSQRLVHYRIAGSGPAIVLLHDSPRSSRVHENLMRKLAARFQVFALDTPGYGNSDPIDIAAPTIPHFAQALGEALNALGLSHAPVYATHTSAKIALALAVRGGRMSKLVLDGLAIPDKAANEAFIQSYMRPFLPEPTGAWLAAEWTRTRDMLRWFPWFTHNPEHRTNLQPRHPEWLEDYGIDLFSAGPHYGDAYSAAMRWNPLDDLKAVKIPTIVAARPDDVLYPHLERVPLAQNAALSVQRPATEDATWVQWLSGRLADDARSRSPADAAAPCQDARGYCKLENGQLHWTRYLASRGASTRALMILSAPSTLEAHQWARAFAPLRPVVVPDLPGFGDSDPFQQGNADAFADALATLTTQLSIEECDVLAIGLASPIAARFAAHYPDLVSTLTVWGSPIPGIDDALVAPEVPFDPIGGTHLHRFWHMLRDSAVQWPWHDQRPEAARPGPIPDPADLHKALTGLLKQRSTYGQAAAAALLANQPADWQRVCRPVLVAVGEDPAMASSAHLLGLIPGAVAFMAPMESEQAASALHDAMVNLSAAAQGSLRP